MYPLIICTRKQMGLIKQLFFFCKSLTIHHFNVQTATAKNKEQDTLSNIISIHFQNCEFFLWDLLCDGLLRWRQMTSKISVMGFIFFDKVAGWVSTTLPKMYSLASTFQGFRSNLLLSIKFSRFFRKVYFPEKHLVVFANHCKVFKIFIPIKIIYSGPDIRVWENLRRIAFRVGN